MTDIRVSFDGRILRVMPDLFPGRGGMPIGGPGNTITWILDPSVGQLDLQVVFSQMVDLNPTSGAEVGPRRPTRGPFSSLSSTGVPGARQIVGTVGGSDIQQNLNQPRRFFYQIFLNGVALTKQPGPTLMIDGGGIDIPRTPP